MPKYIGQPCTSCKDVFKPDDDVVVCPECGSPYHRECYLKEGRCINTALHELGKEWEPTSLSSGIHETAAHEKVCGNCGCKNDGKSFYCTNCGSPLSGEYPEKRTQINENGGFQGGPFGSDAGRMSYGVPPFINISAISADAEVDENTVGEYSDYVGMKSYYYIPKFMRFAKSGSKLSINFAALFFPHLWLAYRKMPVYGALVWLISMLTSLPAYLLNMSHMGFEIAAVGKSWFMPLLALCYVLNYVVNIICAVFGNLIYYRKAKADIAKIKSEKTSSDEAKPEIKMRGGVSLAYVFILIGLTFVVSMAMAMMTLSVGSPAAV